MLMGVASPSVSGFGGLIRNADGVWVHGFAGNIGFSNILHAELLAVYYGLLMACGFGIIFKIGGSTPSIGYYS
jgi:uncharacterized membrane-anchored protein YitT (DUF2179 family)